jgi:hypothetical protein
MFQHSMFYLLNVILSYFRKIRFTYNNFLVDNLIPVTQILNKSLSICEVCTVIAIDQELFPPIEKYFAKTSSATWSNGFM